VVKWTGAADQVRAFFYSDGDPTLLVLTPNGEVLCNDNASDQLLDPFVEIKNPADGDYRIWVGSAAKNQLVPGVLVLTAQPGIDLGTFKLGNLIKRPSIPQTSVRPADVVTPTVTAAGTPGAAAKMTEGIQALTERLLREAPTLQPGVPVTVDVTADGHIPLFRIPAAAHNGCAGLVNGAPSYAFKSTGSVPAMRVAVSEADGDTTLMVVGLGSKKVWCNDDAEAGSTHPVVNITNPAEDSYLVWVGRVSPKAPVKAQINVAQALQGATQ
jgi:hypothetical protein